MSAWRLYYDSDCEFCTRSMRRAVRWAERARQPMEVLPLNGPDARARGYGAELVLEAVKTTKGGDAWLKIIAIGPWALRPLALLERTPLTRALVRRVYEWVAAHRRCDVAQASR